MDVSKFVALLQERKLYFARADQLGDPFEGAPTKANSNLADFIINNRETDPALADYRALSELEIREMRAQYSALRQRFRKEIYVSCWHMSTHESAAMWKLYSQSGDAVCIQTTYSRLSSLLPSWIHMGVVRYVDYEAQYIGEHNSFNFIMHKRSSFAHEHEVRAVGWEGLGETVGGRELRACLCDCGLKVAVDLNALIQSVFVSPTAAVWLKGVVESLNRDYAVKAPVQQSSLLTPPLW